jgi:Protein of unknown function (DUF4238)
MTGTMALFSASLWPMRRRPGFALAGTEVIFPLSTNIALRGTFEGEENVVKSDMATVAQMNSLIISNAENRVYAHDHTFKFKRRIYIQTPTTPHVF